MTPDFLIQDKCSVLVIDDDERIRSLICKYLLDNDYIALSASNAAEAREIMDIVEFDTLVVDVMMPGETGLDFTKDIKKQRDIPVLMLTALGESDDRIKGLESGADDYLPKPFEPRELILRLESLLRRYKPAEQEGAYPVIGPWVYDEQGGFLISKSAKQDSDSDTMVKLTQMEETLLSALLARANQPVSRDNLSQICGVHKAGRTIDVQVNRLRQKLEEDPKNPVYLQTIRGQGYMLRRG